MLDHDDDRELANRVAPQADLANSPGARAFYDQRRSLGDSHHKAHLHTCTVFEQVRPVVVAAGFGGIMRVRSFAVLLVAVVGAAMLVACNPLDAIVEVAGGNAFTCARHNTGKISCWGSNEFGQLGDGSTFISPVRGTDSLNPVEVAGITTATSLTVGASHACATVGDGTALCWGFNGDGQLGNGDTTSTAIPSTVAGLTTVASIAAGYRHTCAALTDGTVTCWGLNSSGQLGDGTTINRLNPVAVGSVTNAATVSAGGQHSCASRVDGTATCWGSNAYGQLGNGSTTDSGSAVPVAGLSGVAVLTTGFRHTCALLDDTTARCWGANSAGQIGDNSTTNRTNAVVVSGLSGAASLGAGDYHSCASLDDGSVRCWGFNANGQLGDGSVANAKVPVTVVQASETESVGAGQNHSCAVKRTGTAKCWGQNSTGQLGDHATADKPTPIDVEEAFAAGPFAELASGNLATCGRTTEGRVLCWGSDRQLGDAADAGTFCVNGSCTPTPVTVSGITTATSIAVGRGHACAALAAGTVQCWGDDGFGQLGDGGAVVEPPCLFTEFCGPTAPAPVMLSGLSGVERVTAGDHHTCAVLADDTARCWGRNNAGQLGDGTTTNDGVAVAVSGLAGVATIDANGNRTCASLTDGTARCWGQSALTPVVVPGLTNATRVTTSCALLADTSVKCGGDLFALAPVPGATGALTLESGGGFHCVTLPDTTARCWGANGSGTLGDGTRTNRATPVTVVGLTGVASMAPGTRHNCAVDTDGKARCWGVEDNGQLGDGITATQYPRTWANQYVVNDR